MPTPLPPRGSPSQHARRSASTVRGINDQWAARVACRVAPPGLRAQRSPKLTWMAVCWTAAPGGSRPVSPPVSHTEGGCCRAAPVSRAVTHPRGRARPQPSCLWSLGLDQDSAHLFTKGLSSQQGRCCIRKTATDTKSRTAVATFQTRLTEAGGRLLCRPQPGPHLCPSPSALPCRDTFRGDQLPSPPYPPY